jgi:hypothetical protein
MVALPDREPTGNPIPDQVALDDVKEHVWEVRNSRLVELEIALILLSRRELALNNIPNPTISDEVVDRL